MSKKESESKVKSVFEVTLVREVRLEKVVRVVAVDEEEIDQAVANGELDDLIGEHDFDYMSDNWNSVEVEGVDELDEVEAKRLIKNSDFDYEVNEEEV